MDLGARTLLVRALRIAAQAEPYAAASLCRLSSLLCIEWGAGSTLAGPRLWQSAPLLAAGGRLGGAWRPAARQQLRPWVGTGSVGVRALSSTGEGHGRGGRCGSRPSCGACGQRFGSYPPVTLRCSWNRNTQRCSSPVWNSLMYPETLCTPLPWLPSARRAAGPGGAGGAPGGGPEGEPDLLKAKFVRVLAFMMICAAGYRIAPWAAASSVGNTLGLLDAQEPFLLRSGLGRLLLLARSSQRGWVLSPCLHALLPLHASQREPSLGSC